MVKSPFHPPSHRPSRAELRARVEEANARGLRGKQALAYAMRQLNEKYNTITHGKGAEPWKKPAGFDYEWWNGSLLHVRLGVKPTKQELKREREKRAKFMLMVKRAQSRKGVNSVSRLPFQRKISFPDPANKEDTRLEALFLEATDEAAARLSPAEMVDPSGKTLLEQLSCMDPVDPVDPVDNSKSDESDEGPPEVCWDLPISCNHSDKCSSVILSAKNV